MAASIDPPRPRTLTESLRGWSPDALERLLLRRPDLVDPAPRDLTELASRSTTTGSTAQALESLNLWSRTTAEGLAALPDPATVTALADLLGEPPDIVARAVDELRASALVWGPDEALHLVRPVRESFEPYPGGLAAPSARPLSESQIADALAECSDAARAVLDRLRWQPSGAVRNADRTVPAAGARSPIDELLALELLRPADSGTVIVPREVAWLRRGRHFTAEPVPTGPPPVAAPPQDPGRTDRAAAGAAGRTAGRSGSGGADPRGRAAPAAADGRAGRTGRAGAGPAPGPRLGVRDLPARVRGGRRPGRCRGRKRPLPTGEYDQWARGPSPERWRQVAEAWAYADRLFARSSLAGAHALGPEADIAGVAVLRGTVLQLLADAGPGAAPDRDQIATAAAWHRPRLRQPPLDAERLVSWTWREAGWLGLVGGNAVSSFAGVLVNRAEPLPPVLAELFPAPLETILIQADLTAVAAGPLAYEVGQDLRRLADQESRGAGGVFRFSADSLRRAYDAGWSSGEISAWLERHSATGVPQPLRYLVDDVSRRHGSIRVGPAASYLRVADEAQAAALLTHPDAAAIGLRAVAPTVLVAAVEEEELLAMVRAAGHAPIVEDAAGRPLLPPAGPRARPRRPRRARDRAAEAAELAAALLAVERFRPRSAEGNGHSTDEALDRLRAATRQAQPVRVTYVNADGRPTEREVAPLDLAAGAVRAVDRASAQVITIPLARISAVAPA